MSSIESLTLNNLFLTAQNGMSEKVENLNKQMQNLPSVMDRETLEDLINGKYEITLQEYTSINNYRNSMKLLFGNNSANPLYSGLNALMGKGYYDNTAVSAKTFLDNMRQKGLSNETALNLYTAMKTYSINNTLLKNNSFISAKI